VGVGPQLNEIGVSERVVTDVVARGEGEVEEETRDTGGGVAAASVEGNLHALQRDGDGNEDQAHASGRKHVHVATLEAGDEHGNDGRVDQTPAGVGKVNARLGVVGGVVHHAEEDTRVVAEQGVAGQLGEETDEERDDNAAAHTIRPEQVHPALLRGLHLRANGLADLHDLSLDEERAGVALSVVLDEHLSGLLIAVLGDEVTGRLGEEEDGGNLQDRGADLQQRGQAPGPVVGNVGGAQSDGRGENLTDEVRGVEQRRQDGTLLGMGQLADEGGTGNDAEQDTGAEDHAGDNVHADMLGETLEESTENHDAGAEHDGPAAAEALREPWRKGDGEDGTKLVARVDESKKTGLDFGRVGLCVSAASTEI